MRPLTLVIIVALALPLATLARVVHVASRDERPGADAIVVLGAAATNGRPGAVLEARLDHARALHAEGVAPLIVTVGGRGAGQQESEADVGARWLAEHGVAAESVVAVSRGQNTLTSLQSVADVQRSAGWRSVVLVSDPWHLYRSRAMAEDVGLPVVGASPAPTGPNVESPQRAAFNVVRETVAFLAYRAGELAERALRAVDDGLAAA